MDISTLPTTRPSVSVDTPLNPVAQVPTRATETRPETARPVEASEPPPNPAPIPGLGIPPLDTFLVGDNDDVPLPPEPPRERGALAEPVAAPQAKPDQAESVTPEQTAEEDVAPSRQAASVEPALPDLLRDLDDGPDNPTVNVLS